MVPVATVTSSATRADHLLTDRDRPAAGRAPLSTVTEAWPVVLGDARPDDGAGPGACGSIAIDGRRPVAMWLAEGRFDRLVPVSARALADEEPADVLRRAMDRPRATRFHPVVVVDRHGGLIGVVPVDRLALLAAAAR